MFDGGRKARLDAAKMRLADIQLVAESKVELEHGREIIKVEPPSNEGWQRPAPPHLTSHWQSISGVHADPPTRDLEGHKPIVSYRRPFPPGGLAGMRPLDERVPVWGGCAAT